jgi:hypothetical protein
MEIGDQRIALSGSAAVAPSGTLTTYRYSGAPFTTSVNAPGATSVTATLVTVGAIPANSKVLLTDPSIVSFEISDGVRTILQGAGSILPTAYVSTDALGNIYDWGIAELDGAGRSFVLINQCCTTGDPPFMYTYPTTAASIFGDLFFGGATGGYAYENGVSGGWVRL